MIPIKNVLKSLTNFQNDWKFSLLAKWPDIIGELVSKVSIEKITQDTIVLSTIDACWMQELYILSPLIRTRINNVLDIPRIKNIRFQQKGLKKRISIHNNLDYQVVNQEVPLTAHEQKALQLISDPELCVMLKKFRNRCFQGKRSC